MLTSPQNDRFDVGGGGRAALELSLSKRFGVEAHYGLFAFPLKTPGSISDYATYHDMGLGLRVHLAPDSRLMDPWVSVDADVIETSGRWRAGAAFGAGLDFRATSRFRVGPFVRYQQVIDSNAADANILLFGVGFAFGSPVNEAATSDADGDGIVDANDSCPYEAETINGFEDSDGCPDQVAAAPPAPEPQQPTCPGSPGCPPQDDDGDGIPNEQDKCPSEAETVNGFQDEDGCPDTITKSIKPVEDRILFVVGSSQLDPVSMPAILKIAEVLRENPEAKLTVEGHADDRGSAELNQRLSQQRADAVTTALLEAGVPMAQLKSVGYGSTRPLAKGRDEVSRRTNRRVQFTVEGEATK